MTLVCEALPEPGKHGFGSRLITVGVSRELDGFALLEFAVDGLRCTLDVPVDEVNRLSSSGRCPAPNRSARPEGIRGDLYASRIFAATGLGVCAS